MSQVADVASLVERSLYPTPPQEIAAEFKAHVARTGQPETFPTISTTRPPKDGAVQVLALGVDVDRNKRLGRTMAPCPICSAEGARWLNGGALIWCEKTAAIYAIGPRCYKTLWTDGRMDIAINEFLQSEREKTNKERLLAAALSAPALQSWIAAQRPTAKRFAELHAGFAKSVPRLRGALSRALKVGSAAVAAIKGRRFLTGAWQLEKKLTEADRILAALKHVAGGDAQSWVEGLSPRAVGQRLEEANRAREALDDVVACCDEGAAFLQPATIRALATWGSDPRCPVTFKAPSTATRVEFRTEHEHWSGQLGLRSCAPLP
jgi:hypothetical protein